MKLLDKIASKVGVYNFDPADVDIIVAGHSLTDFTSATLTPNQKRTTIQGIDPVYHTYVDLPSFCDLSISFLPACPDIEFMEELQDWLDINKGYFEVIMKQNGRFLGTYDCYFKNDSGDIMNNEANDKTYEMVAVKQNDSVFKSELDTDI